MIKLDNKTRQDFLDREWVTRLLDVGVDMSDAKYYICTHLESTGLKGDYIYYAKETEDNDYILSCIPTYTTSELLYKLHEWIYLTINGKDYSGGLTYSKDAPFHCFYYNLKYLNPETNKTKRLIGEIYADHEYPVESLASLLIQCCKRGLGYVNNISDK